MSFILAEDAALKAYLAGTGIYSGTGMVVADEKNQARPVQVWYGYPDVEARTQEFPFVTIELIDIRPASERQFSGLVQDTTNQGTVATAANTVYEYSTPVAYDLEYQLTTYARNPRHDRAILQQMLRKFPAKYGYLQVPNDLGTLFNRHMFMEALYKRDTTDRDSGAKRLLRNFFTVRIVSEMTPDIAAAATGLKTVSTVKINPEPITYVPSTLQNV